jgi:hypothetical protein
MKICVDCKHHRVTASDSPRHRCHHPAFKRRIDKDPVTGRIYPVKKRVGLGGGIVYCEAYSYYPECVDINQKGRCRKWKRR